MAVDLDGIDGYVKCGDVLGFDYNIPFSVSLWINIDNDNSDQKLITKRLAISPYTGWEIAIDGTGSNAWVRFSITQTWSTKVIDVRTDWLLVVGNYYHIVCTYDGSNDVSGQHIYVNADDKSLITVHNKAMDGSIANVAELCIGARNKTVQFYDGRESEVAIWDVELSQTDVSLLYQARLKRMPFQIKKSNLVFYLPLDDVVDGISIDGQTFKDLSGNNYDGTGSDSGGQSVGKAESLLSYP